LGFMSDFSRDEVIFLSFFGGFEGLTPASPTLKIPPNC
jgi:hypothetical protein